MKRLLVLATLLAANAHAQTINPDLPNPELLTKKYLEEMTERKIGQTHFATKAYHYRYQSQHQQQQQQQESQSRSDNREIQEADVFKLGKKGQKELFLLNRTRGFQVVSFEDGLETPKLVGRFPVYNNYSSEMYYLESQDKVMILNTEWSYSKNHWATNYNTKVYLMDVKDSANPKLVQEYDVPGYLSESRLVGDVLYAITNSGNWDQQKAGITSIKLNDNGMTRIDSADLHGENKWVRTMNVVQSGSKYYVISTSTDWNNGGDDINVHDITSGQGDVKKLFSAKARGRIAERSMTFLHKDLLFAVSNYQGANNIMRISVEAFPMAESTKVIESKENMRLSVGDTNGLHASLQDVRVSGDMLYAFWVPANNIDPFELFDISNPKEGIKHLGQLQFDGWISKAFPIEHNNKKYVLGLGSVVPVTSETGKQYPQAKMFEIKKVNGTYKHEVVASLTIESDDFWSNLNTEDKYFEMVQDAPGVYNVLFPVMFRKSWKDGAKVITADFNTGTIQEGASVIGEQGWLNRVFLNREVRALNAFSDQSLETFRQEDMTSRGFAKAVSLLELSRNIVDFKVLSPELGLQVVSADKQVELRKVSLKNSDAEKNEVLSMMAVKGKYEWHKVKGGRVYVITSFTKKKTQTYGEGQSYDYEAFDYANLNVIDLSTSSETVERINITKSGDENDNYYYFDLQAIKTDEIEVLKISNQFFKIVGNSLKKLAVEENCKYFFDTKSESFSLETVGQDIYAFTTFDVNLKDENQSTQQDKVYYKLPFTKKLSFDEDKVSCSNSINVPGRPVMSREGMMVTNELDSHYYYRRGGIHYEYCGGDGYDYYQKNNGKTFSLKYNGPQEVMLTDILDHDITNGLFNDGFITYSAADSRLDVWRLTADGEFLAKPQYLNAGGENSSLITVKRFNSRNFLFMKNEKLVNLYEISKNHKVSRIPVTSTHDLHDDGAAEYIFGIDNIDASADLSRFHISQGAYGVADIIVK